jgi:hypothetical protein
LPDEVLVEVAIWEALYILPHASAQESVESERVDAETPKKLKSSTGMGGRARLSTLAGVFSHAYIVRYSLRGGCRGLFDLRARNKEIKSG